MSLAQEDAIRVGVVVTFLRMERPPQIAAPSPSLVTGMVRMSGSWSSAG